MLLSSHHAQSIVEDMYHIANYNLIFANDEGIIIASVDKRRIGDLHEGALEVLRTKQKVVVKHDRQYRGAKTGISYPIFLHTRIIGVIGITGKEEEVDKIGEIVKRVVEMLVKEIYMEKQKDLEHVARESFIQDWLLQRQEDEEMFTSRGLLLGIDVTVPRVAGIYEFIRPAAAPVSGEALHNEELYKQRMKSRIIKKMKDLLPNAAVDLVTAVNSTKYVLLLAVPPEAAEQEGREQLTAFTDAVKHWAAAELHCDVAAGAGRCSSGVAEIRQSYMEGEKAVYFSSMRTDCPLTFYEDLRIERLIYDLPPEKRREYVQGILQPDAFADPQQALETLYWLFKHNHSINEVAQQLHIHKNTVQYRLNKIKELTGFDPRVFEDAAVLYLAVVLHSLEEKSRP